MPANWPGLTPWSRPTASLAACAFATSISARFAARDASVVPPLAARASATAFTAAASAARASSSRRICTCTAACTAALASCSRRNCRILRERSATARAPASPGCGGHGRALGGSFMGGGPACLPLPRPVHVGVRGVPPTVCCSCASPSSSPSMVAVSPSQRTRPMPRSVSRGSGALQCSHSVGAPVASLTTEHACSRVCRNTTSLAD